MTDIINGEAIARLRQQKGMDQRTFAEHAGVSEAVLSRIERNTQQGYNLNVIVKVADALEVSVDALLNRDYQIRQPVLTSDLKLVVEELAGKDNHTQNQAAAILRGFLEYEDDEPSSE